MGIVDRLLGRQPAEERSAGYPLPFNDWVGYFGYAGNGYTFLPQQTMNGNKEEISGDFSSLVQQAYKSNGVVFACMLTRQLLFSEARFQFRQRRGGRPGDLFGTADLKVLETPWPGATTGDLLTRAIQDADLSGNFFGVRRAGPRIRRLRPDWVDLVIGTEGDTEIGDVDAEVLGYVYYPGGRTSGRDSVVFDRSEVVHFAPTPDPAASFRGMSWLTPIIREIAADSAMTTHKSSFIDKGATPNMIVKLDAKPDDFERFVRMFEEKHEGAANAYKTLFLAGGADATVVGSTFREMDYKSVQGAGETRIAAAAGVPPVIVGLSEGLAQATYSNYAQARRRFADGTIRPLWRNFAGSLSNIIPVPPGAELWYDDRDIPFIREDLKDEADIQAVHSSAIKMLIDAGFDADSVVSSVTAGDLNRLTHTGLFSVQLQPPGTSMTPQAPAPQVPAVQAASAEVVDLEARMRADAAMSMAEMSFTRHVVNEAVQAALPGMPEIRVDVAAPEINITTPDVTVNAPDITVNTPEVRVEPTIEVQAPDVHVSPAEVTVTTPEVRVEPHFDIHQPEPAEVHVTSPEITVHSPEVNVAAPDVHVAAPDVHVEPRFEVQAAPAPEVHVEAPVTVNMPETPRTRKVVERDKDDNIVAIHEEPED